MFLIDSAVLLDGCIVKDVLFSMWQTVPDCNRRGYYSAQQSGWKDVSGQHAGGEHGNISRIPNAFQKYNSSINNNNNNCLRSRRFTDGIR